MPTNDINKVRWGDIKYKSELQIKLNPYVTSLGEKLLSGVREWYDGDLKYYEKSKRYVETPNNFWTVDIQPQNQCLKVTVFGIPENFSSSILKFKLYDRYYTQFYIFNEKDLIEGLRIIKISHKVKKNYRSSY